MVSYKGVMVLHSSAMACLLLLLLCGGLLLLFTHHVFYGFCASSHGPADYKGVARALLPSRLVRARISACAPHPQTRGGGGPPCIPNQPRRTPGECGCCRGAGSLQSNNIVREGDIGRPAWLKWDRVGAEVLQHVKDRLEPQVLNSTLSIAVYGHSQVLQQNFKHVNRTTHMGNFIAIPLQDLTKIWPQSSSTIKSIVILLESADLEKNFNSFVFIDKFTPLFIGILSCGTQVCVQTV